MSALGRKIPEWEAAGYHGQGCWLLKAQIGINHSYGQLGCLHTGPSQKLVAVFAISPAFPYAVGDVFTLNPSAI